MTPAEAMLSARLGAGLTQQEVAERIGLTKAQVSHWETARRRPKLPSLIKLADALGVTLDQLVGRCPPDPDQLIVEMATRIHGLCKEDQDLVEMLARRLTRTQP